MSQYFAIFSILIILGTIFQGNRFGIQSLQCVLSSVTDCFNWLIIYFSRKQVSSTLRIFYAFYQPISLAKMEVDSILKHDTFIFEKFPQPMA